MHDARARPKPHGTETQKYARVLQHDLLDGKEVSVAQALEACGGSNSLFGLGRFQWMLLGMSILMNLSIMGLVLLLSFVLDDVAFFFGLDTHENALQLSLLDSTVYFGWLTGASLLGEMADSHGRKRTMILSSIGVCAAGLLSAASGGIYLLGFLRFLLGCAVGGGESTCFILVAEYCTSSSRAFANLIFQSGGSLGVAFLALTGHSFLANRSPLSHDGWRGLTLVVSTPVLLMLALSPWLPETPQWFLAQGRDHEAWLALKRSARVNRVYDLPDHVPLVVGETAAVGHGAGSGGSQSGGLLQGRLRCTTLLSWLLWFTCGMTYWGMTEQAGQSDGADGGLDKYWALACSGLLEIPGNFACFVGMDRFGRRTTVVTSLSISAASFFIMLTPLPAGLLSFVGMLAKFCVACSFSGAYGWTAELFPSTLRGRAMGTCSSAARLGGMLAPLVVVALAELHEAIPSVVFGIMSALTAVAAMKLRETKEGLGASQPEMKTMEQH